MTTATERILSRSDLERRAAWRRIALDTTTPRTEWLALLRGAQAAGELRLTWDEAERQYEHDVAERNARHEDRD